MGKYSGNPKGVPPPVGYCKKFREIIGVFERKLDPTLTEKDIPSPMWCFQMAHQSKLHPITCGRLYGTTYVYTRHALVKRTSNNDGRGGTHVRKYLDEHDRWHKHNLFE